MHVHPNAGNNGRHDNNTKNESEITLWMWGQIDFKTVDQISSAAKLTLVIYLYREQFGGVIVVLHFVPDMTSW